MELRVFIEPQQGATHDDLLAVARRAEQLGFGATGSRSRRSPSASTGSRSLSR